jgi:hypothetical protein
MSRSKTPRGSDVVDADFVVIDDFPTALGKSVLNPLNIAYIKLSLLVGALFVICMLMLGLNTLELRGLNVIPFFLIGAFILFIGYQPRFILVALGLGALSNYPQTTLIKGAANGVATLHKVVMSALFGFWFVTGLLVIHPWHQSPGMFLALMVVCAFVLSLCQAYDFPSDKRLVVIPCLFYALVVAIFAFTSTIPNSWRGEMFDPRNGESIYMMEQDGSRVYTDTTVANCQQDCFSKYTGKKLVPVTSEVANKHGFSGISKRAEEVASPFIEWSRTLFLNLPLVIGTLLSLIGLAYFEQKHGKLLLGVGLLVFVVTFLNLGGIRPTNPAGKTLADNTILTIPKVLGEFRLSDTPKGIPAMHQGSCLAPSREEANSVIYIPSAQADGMKHYRSKNGEVTIVTFSLYPLNSPECNN